MEMENRQLPSAQSDDYAEGVVIASGDRPVLVGWSKFDGEVVSLARLTGDTTIAAAQVNDGTANDRASHR